MKDKRCVGLEVWFFLKCHRSARLQTNRYVKRQMDNKVIVYYRIRTYLEIRSPTMMYKYNKVNIAIALLLLWGVGRGYWILTMRCEPLVVVESVGQVHKLAHVELGQLALEQRFLQVQFRVTRAFAFALLAPRLPGNAKSHNLVHVIYENTTLTRLIQTTWRYLSTN